MDRCLATSDPDSTLVRNEQKHIPPAKLPPFPGCLGSGSSDDDPGSHTVIFHPGARGFCSHPRAKACLKLARPWNADRQPGASRVPRHEILPTCPPQPQDRGRDADPLSPSSAGAAAHLLFVTPNRGNRFKSERRDEESQRPYRFPNDSANGRSHDLAELEACCLLSATASADRWSDLVPGSVHQTSSKHGIRKACASHSAH